MNTRKTVRDALIIVVIIVAAFFIIRSNRPGPVESVNIPDTSPQGDSHNHDTPTPMHGMTSAQISDGDLMVSFGEASIGSIWFDEQMSAATQSFLSRGVDESTAAEMGKIAALVHGLELLLAEKAIQEYGIVPDQAELDSRWQSLISEFGSEEEAEAFIEQQGMDMDRVREMWEKESVKQQLMIKIAEMQGVEPDSEDASTAFETWLQQRLKESEFIFNDPDLEALFNHYMEMESEETADTIESGDNGPDLDETSESVPSDTAH